MPFIWDDLEWKSVNDEDSYDKNRFVVVRKLRVKLNADPYDRLPIPQFSIDQIRQRIEHFGEIESIEMLTKDEPEAYVTFVSDHGAYSMQSQHDEDKEAEVKQPFQIQPADTWEQPRENINPPSEQSLEQTSEIFILNEDCLRHLFKFLDVASLVDLADVCKLFNRLLHQHCFPRIRKFEVKNDYRYQFAFPMPLAKMRRILQCIGQYITDLHFECNVDEEESDLRHDVVTKFLEVLAGNIGANIRRASIHCTTICQNNRFLILAPIFRHLELLKLDALNEELGVDINFHAMCPNLIDLEVNVDVPMETCGKRWPSLHRLAVLRNDYMDTTALIALIKRNPQLTCIEFTDDPDEHVTLAASNLHMLEKVEIAGSESYYAYLSGYRIACLNRLQHLTEITLINLHPGSLKAVIDSLAAFVGLRKINLHKNTVVHDEDSDQDDEMNDEGVPNYLQSLIKLAQKQSKLEDFTLSCVTVTESCLIDFVRFASQLKKLKLSSCGLKFSDELIVNLVDVLKCNRPQPNQVLLLKLDSFKCDNLTAINSESVSRYLQIKPF